MSINNLKKDIDKLIDLFELTINSTEKDALSETVKFDCDMITNFIDYIRRQLDNLSFKDMQTLKYVLTSQMLLFSAEIVVEMNKKILSIQNDIEEKYRLEMKNMTPVEQSLYDADKSIELLIRHSSEGLISKIDSDPLVKDLLLYCERLKAAVKSGDDVQIALEHRQLQNVIAKICREAPSLYDK